MSTEGIFFEEVHGLLRRAEDLLVRYGDGMPAIEADILKEQLRGMYAALLPKAGGDAATRHDDGRSAEGSAAEGLALPEREDRAAAADEGLYAPAEPEPESRPAMRPMMEQLEGSPFDNLFDEGVPRFVDMPVAAEPQDRPVTVKPMVEAPARAAAAEPAAAEPKAVKAGDEGVRKGACVPEGEAKPSQSHTSQGNEITLMDFLRQSSAAGVAAAPAAKGPKAADAPAAKGQADAPSMLSQAVEANGKPAKETAAEAVAPRKPAETSVPRPVAETASAPVTLADKLGLNSTVESQVGTKVSHSKVSDLRTIININDKFSFMSELFHNNMKAYNDFILRLNAISDRQAALEHVQLIAQEFQWDMESLAVKTFYGIFDRKF